MDLLPQSALVNNSQDLSERVTDAPVLFAGRVFFTTRIQFKPADPCDTVTGTGWLMALDALTGGRDDDVFDVNGDRKVDENDKVSSTSGTVSPSGLRSTVGVPRMPTFMGAGTIVDVYMPGSGVNDQYVQRTAVSDPDVGRQSWRQLR